MQAYKKADIEGGIKKAVYATPFLVLGFLGFGNVMQKYST